ncbi:MAG: efflux RND transporter periplasmic adaptor subunit [Gemmatimonadetes bacterium]|nr:efflux RND transporter periplasmic adaptor subunit [Gemmatimonadota bacterium]
MERGEAVQGSAPESRPGFPVAVYALRRHAGLGLLLVVTACAVAACDGAPAPAAEAKNDPVLVAVENIAVVRSQRIEHGPVLSGSLRPEQEAAVRAEVAGAVLQTYAEQGQRVSRGTPLARLEDTALRDAFLSAKSSVATAEQAAVVARRNAERAERLAAAGALAERELEGARWNAMSAESQLADARARLALAEKQLGKTTVRSPITGVVSRREVSGGDVVQPGMPLFTVVDPSRMRLEAAVPAEQLGVLRLGAPVRFTVQGYGTRSFEGRVERISPTADPATRQIALIVSIPNAGGSLVAGLFAEGRVAAEVRAGLAIPHNAVDLTGSTPAVLRIQNGRVERVLVELGIEDELAERVEVRSGLSEGDTILVNGARGVAPGTAVRVQKAAAPVRLER